NLIISFYFAGVKPKLSHSLNLSYFISKRISQGKQSGFSSTIHTIAIVSIGIGLGAAIVSFLIMNGFQETVKNRIYSFNGQLLITKFSTDNSVEEVPFDINFDVFTKSKDLPYVDHMQEFAHKAGLVKTNDEILGVVLKGVGKSFDTAAFKTNMVDGRFIHFPDSGYSNEVVLSRVIASKLKVKTGDQVTLHFFQNPPRFRRLKVTGIYETNLSEYFDGKIVIGDIRLIQRLNDWADSIAGGIEIYLKPGANADDAQLQLETLLETDMKKNFDKDVESIAAKYSQVFEWLNLLDRQVAILLVIILFVISVNMISIILILVMERTQMIGMLKALGASGGLIRSIFVYNGINLLIKGLLLGNLLGIGFCYLQDTFKIIKLNPEDYYMSFVPISWHWDVVLMLNLLTFVMVTLVLLLPTAIVFRITPIKAIRFD
ncbi:MAG TPA: ABC transporter permease, partial [Cyclobacteriaceae bacterium]|nr:ABC transporter permease [Cyclobacteriaceae bacterium]